MEQEVRQTEIYVVHKRLREAYRVGQSDNIRSRLAFTVWQRTRDGARLYEFSVAPAIHNQRADTIARLEVFDG